MIFATALMRPFLILLVSLVFSLPALAEGLSSDTDLDADGIVDVFDNCPAISNPEQDERCGDHRIAPLESAGSESAVTANGPVVLYNVDFESPPHTPGTPPIFEEGPAPRYTPTQLRFGAPLVVETIAPDIEQWLELQPGPHPYEQVTFALASNLGNGGFDEQYATYHFELTVVIEEVGLDRSALTVIVDGPMAHQINFTPEGNLIARVLGDPINNVEGYAEEIGQFEIGVPLRLRVELDTDAERWEIFVDGILEFSGPYPIVCDTYFAGQCMRNLRLNASGSASALVDDVLVMDRMLVLDVDIKPGSCPDSWNRKSNGVLPVAILGTEDFDVTQIDVSSATISRAYGRSGSVGPNEGPPGPHSVFADVGTPFEGDECDCHEAEGDGIVDLSMKFKTEDVADLLPVDDPGGALVPLLVSGTLLDGTPFRSRSECVRLVPPGSPPGQVTVRSAAGGWVDATPLDNSLDGGGFGSFKRTYPHTTVLMLTAPSSHGDNPFVGWKLDGGEIVQKRSITLVVNDAEHVAQAVFKDVNGCGLGFELVALIPFLSWLRRRSKRGRAA